MLLIIELLFLVAGIWAIISGKIPLGFLKFLFGNGDYKILPKQTRLLGIFIASPLPVSFIVSLIFIALFGTKGTGYAIIFEIIYLFVVIITSIIVMNKAKQPEKAQIEKSLPLPSSIEKKTRSYSRNLLIIFGLVVIGCITTWSFGTLALVIINSIRFSTSLTGNFWSEIFPLILLVTILGIGSFGIIKLVKILRK